MIPKSFLMCEDDPVYVETVAYMFELYAPESELIVVYSLHDAIALLEYKPDAFDIIIIDLMLPDSKDIYTLRAFLRVAQDTPLVVLTAHREFEQECIRLGAREYILKNNISGKCLVERLHKIAEEWC